MQFVPRAQKFFALVLSLPLVCAAILCPEEADAGMGFGISRQSCAELLSGAPAVQAHPGSSMQQKIERDFASGRALLWLNRLARSAPSELSDARRGELCERVTALASAYGLMAVDAGSIITIYERFCRTAAVARATLLALTEGALASPRHYGTNIFSQKTPRPWHSRSGTSSRILHLARWFRYARSERLLKPIDWRNLLDPTDAIFVLGRGLDGALASVGIPVAEQVEFLSHALKDSQIVEYGRIASIFKELVPEDFRRILPYASPGFELDFRYRNSELDAGAIERIASKLNALSLNPDVARARSGYVEDLR